MSETAFGSLLLRIQLEVFLSSCDLASVSLFLNWKQYKIFVNLSSRSLPWYLYFLFLVVRAPPNHTSELWSGTWSRCSLLLLIWLKKLKARYLRSPGKILLVNVSCPLFTLVSFYQLSQIDYHWAGKKKKQQAHHMPLARICQSSAPSLRRLGSDTWGVVATCVHFSSLWFLTKCAGSWGGGQPFKLIWVLEWSRARCFQWGEKRSRELSASSMISVQLLRCQGGLPVGKLVWEAHLHVGCCHLPTS